MCGPRNSLCREARGLWAPEHFVQEGSFLGHAELVSGPGSRVHALWPPMLFPPMLPLPRRMLRSLQSMRSTQPPAGCEHRGRMAPLVQPRPALLWSVQPGPHPAAVHAAQLAPQRPCFTHPRAVCVRL